MLEDVLYVEETRVTVRKDRHKTTVPARIFKLLKLKEGDSLRLIAMRDGKILIEKSPQGEAHHDAITIGSITFSYCEHIKS